MGSQMNVEEGCTDDCLSPPQSILFTIDLNDPYAKKGLLWGSNYPERLEKSSDGYPYIKTIWNVKSNATLTFPIESNDSNAERMSYMINGIDDTFPKKFSSLGEVTLKLIENGSNTIYSMNTEFKVGGNYQIVIQYREDNIFMEPIFIHEITTPNMISTFWQLPQIMIITAGEILFSITSLKFAFSQAPESMKAVIMAISLMTNAIGNIITLLITEAFKDVFGPNELAYNFFIFAGLMFLDMMLLAWMAMGYKYIDCNDSSQCTKDELEVE